MFGGHQRCPERMSLQGPRGTSGGHPGLLQNSSQLGHWANSKWSPRPSRAQKADHDNLQESKQVKSDSWIRASICSKVFLLFVTFAVVSLVRQWNLPHPAGTGDLPQVPGPATCTRNGSWSKTCESHCWHLTRGFKLISEIDPRQCPCFVSFHFLSPVFRCLLTRQVSLYTSGWSIWQNCFTP